MASVGTLAVSVTARTSQLTSGLKTAGSQLSGFARGLGGLAKRAAGLSTALTGLSVGGIAALTKSSMSAIDATAKLSDQLGINIGRLTELRHAANLTGPGAAKLDNALQSLTRSIGQAAQGTGPAVRGLDRIGLSAASLMRLAPDEQFSAIADGIAAIPNPAEQAQVAMQLFGRSGAEMVNMLKEGSAGLAAMGEESRRLKQELTRVDAAKVEAANDALQRMKESFSGIGEQLAVQLAPLIEAGANRFSEWAQSGFSASSIVTRGLEGAVNAFGVAADVVHTVKLGFQGLGALATAALAGITRGIAILGESLATLANLIPGVNVTFDKALTGMADNLEKMASERMERFHAAFLEDPPSVGIASGFDEIKESAAAAAKEIAKAAEERARMREFQEDIEDAAAKFDELSKFASRMFEQTRTPMERFQADMDKLREAFEAGLLDDDTFARASKRFHDELQAALDDGVDVGLGQSSLDALQGPRAAGRGTSDAFSSILSAMRGTDSPDLKIEKNTAEIAKSAKRQEQHLRDIAGHPPVEFVAGTV